MKRNKYHSQKCKINGTTFDSKREARRYTELVLLQKAGKICDLGRQVKFHLVPAQYENYERYGKNGKRLKDGRRCLEHGIDYIADFVYYDNSEGRTIVEDTKGVKTKEYVIKRKLMLWVHGIRVREI